MAETRPKNAVVTGGSKNIGREIGLYLAKTNIGRVGNLYPESWSYPQANVAIGYRSNNENNQRRNARLAEAMQEAGSDAIAVQGDLTIPLERTGFVDKVGYWAAQRGGIDLLVLNAAGGLEEDAPEGYGELVNDIAQVALVNELSPHMASSPTVMLLESSWSELYPQLGGPVLPGYREKVAATKKQGRDHVVELVAERFEAVGGRALILAAGIVKGSAIGRLAEEHFPDFYQEQLHMGNVVEMKSVAEAAMDMAHDASLEHGYVGWVGAEPEELVAKYPAEEA